MLMKFAIKLFFIQKSNYSLGEIVIVRFKSQCDKYLY